MTTINIYKDNTLLKTFDNQESDINAFGWLLRNQGQSVDYALRYGGYKVELIDETTGEKEYYKPYSIA
jgi:hypothetical protein